MQTMINNLKYSTLFTQEEIQKIIDLTQTEETPFLIVDLKKIEHQFKKLQKAFHYAKIYYAIKANPHEKIVTLLNKLGSYFDIASIYELDHILKLGVSPEKISYGNTIKKIRDIKYAYEKGVRLFVCDNETDLINLSKYAPGANVFFRLLTNGDGADWPLSRKFGAHPDLIYKLIKKASKMDINPIGLSFHVGSQQRDIGQWDNAIAQSFSLFRSLKKNDIKLSLLNIGGGLPASYLQPTPEITIYANQIYNFLVDYFTESQIPDIIIEPGRGLVGDAGVIVSKVIFTEKKAEYNQYKWVYLDIGVFGGLIETLGESIKYPIYIPNKNWTKTQEVILAGPTCDSMDILYEDFKYNFPEEIEPEDLVLFFATGAYTTTYSSVWFNGFPPLKSIIWE